MTETTGSNATQTGDKPTPKASKAKSGVGYEAKVRETEPLKLNEAGQQLHSDGLPLARVARAKALAADGKTKDPEGIVPDDAIAAYDPKAKEADREAVAQFHAEEAEAARAAAEKAAAAEPAAKGE